MAKKTNKTVFIVVASYTHEVWKVFDTREKAQKWIGNSHDYDWEVWEVE